MMDRNKAAELPKLQVGFIDFVCTFVYKVSTPGSQAEEGTGGVALPPNTALARVLLIPVLTVGTVSSQGEATTTSSGPGQFFRSTTCFPTGFLPLDVLPLALRPRLKCPFPTDRLGHPTHG